MIGVNSYGKFCPHHSIYLKFRTHGFILVLLIHVNKGLSGGLKIGCCILC